MEIRISKLATAWRAGTGFPFPSCQFRIATGKSRLETRRSNPESEIGVSARQRPAAEVCERLSAADVRRPNFQFPVSSFEFRTAMLSLIALALSVLTGCRLDMHVQPKY